MTLGETLTALRTFRGWSQRALARCAAVRQPLLSEVESGKKQDTTGRNLRRLALTLGVSADYLLGMYDQRQCPLPPRKDGPYACDSHPQTCPP
jgi:transcriptional regulator with XRE-family HTH domain